ncbi:MAG: oligosaccharide flippase family protein, partial [Porphyromonadaceae bacterium]|nr:oligosaccharide flippase family protein [Porphyromonadaceae bacterium]
MAQPGESTRLYRRIVKATGLLGSVQLFSILCSIVRNKCIALWLGPAGVGIISLYNTSVEMVGSLTGLGLRQSAVRNVSQAQASGRESFLADTVTMLRRWSCLTGLLGAVVMLSTAPLLSRFTFGDDQHIWGYVWLSCALLFNALVSGDQAILQGTQRLRQLSKSVVFGNLAALLLSLPLYYFFRFEGIVPSLVLSAAATLLFVWLYSRKVLPGKSEISWRETYRRGRCMVVLGIYMTVSGFLTTLFNYLFIAFLHHTAGDTELGYYQSGYAVVTRYVGLVLAAMATEYYPRLAAVEGDNRALGVQVARQIETVLLLLAPIVSFFLLLQEWVMRLLYTAEFLCVETYFSWAMVGVLFKAISWAMGFVLLAKGNGKLFLITEFASDFCSFLFHVGGYSLWGLEGAGVAC